MTRDDELAQLLAENAGLRNLLRALALVIKELLRAFPLNVQENETVRRARDVTNEIISATRRNRQRQRGGHAN
jgi:hypothetical protein